jgi:hypothetical protein
MAAPPREPSLSEEQRRALTLLANIPQGIAEELLILAHGFDRGIIAGLVHGGLAKEQREVVMGSGRTLIEVVRILITEAGLGAIER